MEIFDIKCDKLRLSGNISDSDIFVLTNYIQNDIETETIGLTTSTSVRGKFFCMDENSVYFEYDKTRADSWGINNFFLEFNPSKLSQDRQYQLKTKILYAVSDLKANRYDLAVEFDFSLADVWHEVKGQKVAKYYGVNGELETWYIGTSGSDMLVRIYNKNKQLEDTDDLENRREGDWWRYEVQYNRWRLIEKIFDNGFSFDRQIKIPDYSSVSPMDKIVLNSMNSTPDLFSSLSKNTKTSYRKKMRELPALLDVRSMINSALKEKTPQLLGELKGWLASGKLATV
ncbi:replication initiation factor domain-containing protein [Enterococcus durans]|uniref:replication initiation factor domain-containing protein n=1 Tax=Enterococcus durans TaxID=53345 RepID=UPI001784D416|nr:replication initiation factor domain-containing protein [Enterococcus durans]